jgi:hypothetical protein
MTLSLETRILLLLQARFPGQSMQAFPGKSPFAVFPAIHSDVGDIEISDDGDELTVLIGKFTHSHFANYDQGISDDERADRISQALVSFLDDLFADRIEMYGTHLGGGGTRVRGRQALGVVSKASTGSKTFVWSGPLRNDA